MDVWTIRGGKRLEGSYRVQGSKNATLPILAASILSGAESELSRVPALTDVDAALQILRYLGCRTESVDGRVRIDASALSESSVPHELMRQMRSSVIFMGALLAFCGEARLSLPGGCRLGKRPIDLHLSALRRLGAEIEEQGLEICCRASKLHGATVCLPFPSVGATENIMLAATAAEGETRILGAAREPEIGALQDYLCAMGCAVRGAGSDCVTVTGCRPLHGADFAVPPDRIAAATLACAVASAGGAVELRDAKTEHFSALLHFLKQAGCVILYDNACAYIRCDARLHALGEIATAPYPGFPTDVQPLLMAALLRSEGVTRIWETIFESRFRQVPELLRLGADVRVSGRCAEIRGVERLRGAALNATDLRGGAAMVLAGLASEGETQVFDAGHIARGYEHLERALAALGAEVSLVHTNS